jgi:hypothetical protein
VVPDASTVHGRTFLRQHRLAPLRQFQENGRTRHRLEAISMDTTSNPDFAVVSAVCSLLSSLTVPLLDYRRLGH